MTLKLTSPRDVRSLLNRLGLQPRRSMGQNFLIDEHMVDQILEAAWLGRDDGVIEIGPGLGVLTERMAGSVRRLVAIEKDRGLMRYLREELPEQPGLEWIEGDALKADWTALLHSGLNKVVSNLPYATGTRILVDLLGEQPGPDLLVLTLQDDVALRLMARPREKAYGLLALFSQNEYRVECIKIISPSCFYPAPRVQSAVVRLTRRHQPLVPLVDPALYRNLLRWAFSQRRKQIQHLLYHAPPPLTLQRAQADSILQQSGIRPSARPEELDVSTWVQLANNTSKEYTK